MLNTLEFKFFISELTLSHVDHCISKLGSKFMIMVVVFGCLFNQIQSNFDYILSTQQLSLWLDSCIF